MGRKAIPRERKNNPSKMGDWTQKLFPYFQKVGLDHVTMDEIAEYLGKSKTTLYDYFQTKEDLLALIISEKINAIKGFTAPLNNGAEDFPVRYKTTIEFLSEQISDITILFLNDLRELFPELWKTVEKFFDDSSAIMKEFYAKGIRGGEFNPLNTSLLVLTDQLFFQALVNPAMLEKHKLTPAQATQEYIKLRFESLLKEQN